jgi:hypothetical protein
MPWHVAFWQFVQTWLLKSNDDADSCVRVLYEAQRARKAHIPSDLSKAVFEFIDWRLRSRDQPTWVSHPIAMGLREAHNLRKRIYGNLRDHRHAE